MRGRWVGERGFVADTDVFNHSTPGVTEGVWEFFYRSRRRLFRTGPRLAPFAQCYNKLFVTTPDFHARMNWHGWDFFAPESVLTPEPGLGVAGHERRRRVEERGRRPARESLCCRFGRRCVRFRPSRRK